MTDPRLLDPAVPPITKFFVRLRHPPKRTMPQHTQLVVAAWSAVTVMLIFATIIPLWIYSSTPPPPPVTKFSEKCLFPNRPSNLDQIRYVMAGVGTLSFSNAMTFTIYGFYKKIPWMPLIAIALWAAHSYLFLQITGYYTGGNGIFPGQPCLPRT